MKIGSKKLRMSDGSIRTFKSRESRDKFEKFAKAYNAGWRPTRKNK